MKLNAATRLTATKTTAAVPVKDAGPLFQALQKVFGKPDETSEGAGIQTIVWFLEHNEMVSIQRFANQSITLGFQARTFERSSHMGSVGALVRDFKKKAADTIDAIKRSPEDFGDGNEDEIDSDLINLGKIVRAISRL